MSGIRDEGFEGVSKSESKVLFFFRKHGKKILKVNEHNDGLNRNTSSSVLSQTTSNTHQLYNSVNSKEGGFTLVSSTEVITLLRFSSSSAYEKEKHREVKLWSLGRRK